MRMLIMFCGLLTLAACSGPDKPANVASTESVAAAVDTRSDVEIVRALAEAGDVDAQYNLGVMFATGRGVPQNDEEAVRFYRLAADQGYAEAQFNLAVMYELGRGLPQDDVEATWWFGQAAVQGLANSQYALANSYLSGVGVPEDYEEAEGWYRLSADQGYGPAQMALGNLYVSGVGVPQDYEEAARWYRLSADQEYAPEQSGGILSVAHHMQSQWALGSLYELGLGVRLDNQEAVRWYRLAAEQDYAMAQNDLGLMYDLGKGVPQDDEEAVRWYRLAVEQRLANAQNNLGTMYDHGEGLPENDIEAVRLYRLAADQGYALAQNNLATMYDTGQGVPVDDEEAARLYFLAAVQENTSAQDRLAEMYDAGEGISQDYEEAARLYRIACEERENLGACARAETLETIVASQNSNIAFSDINFGTYHALVIGNNDYQSNELQDLRTAVADAEAVKQILEDKYGFTVTLLTNATRAQIMNELNRFRNDLKESDNFLLYYAGHGVIDEVTNTGYWLPVNAELNNNTQWIHNNNVTTNLNGLMSRNVMVIADSCYSAIIFRGSNSVMLAENREQEVRRLNEKRTRVALTSGGMEPVVDALGGSDHSVFADSFLNALEDNDTYLLANTLFQTVRQRVISMTTNAGIEQTPEFNNLATHDGGDFIFVPNQQP